MDFSSLFLNPRSILGNNRVWMAFADDVATFNNHRSNIQNHLRHSGIPECSEHLLIALYRIGRSRDQAQTVVVVSCTNHRIRKLTKEGLRSCPHFQEGGALAHFKIIGKATPPETAREPEPTMQAHNGSSGLSNISSEELILYAQPSRNTSGDRHSGVILSRDRSTTGNDYLGSQILARQQPEQGAPIFQSATAGPLILVDGQSYQLTVQHVANFDCANAPESHQEVDDWDDEDIENLEGSCDSDEVLASWNAPTSLPESSESQDMGEAVFSDTSSGDSVSRNVKLEASGILDQESQPLDHGSTANTTGLSGPGQSSNATTQELSSLIRSGALDERSPLYGSAEIDYVLIPTDVGLGRVPGSAEIVQKCDYFNVYGITEARSVIIATAIIGYVRGVMFPSPIFSRRPRSQSFQTLFCVQSERAIPKGASGSAIFDEETGLLAGHIVLGCPTEGIWYMTPISTVLDDLRERLCVQASCQIQLDATTLKGTSPKVGGETKEYSTSQGVLGPGTMELNGFIHGSLRESQSQSSVGSSSNNGPATSPQHTLGRLVRERVFEPKDRNLQSFLPRDQLENILTEDRIIQVLGIEGGFPPEGQKAIAQEIIRPLSFHPVTQPHLCSRKEILAILSMIGKVSTIESFIESELFDYDLPFQYSPNGHVVKTCDTSGEAREISLFYQWSDTEIESFENRQWMIHVPIFDRISEMAKKPTHYALAQRAVLPYVSKDEVERGGFSVVDKVEIHAAHVAPSDDPSPKTVFAVKRLETWKKHEFDAEVSNLSRFTGKDAPHLIQLLWTFSLGQTYFLVLPCADGNLKDLWKLHESPLAAKKDYDTALWFSRQCLGIVEGLHMIQQESSGHDSLESQNHGIHGDLKPENILWFSDSRNPEPGYSLGTLKISDFGQTRFNKTESKAHVNIDWIGRPLTYRAPEYEILHEVTQSYDIWCLGCILLEFTTWYIQGWAALDRFSQRRKQEHWGHLKLDTFFNHRHNPNAISAGVKKAVADEVQTLYRHENTSDLIIELVEFIETSLLRMHPEHRKKCSEVLAQLEKFFDMSCRDPDYCLELKKAPFKKYTDLSQLSYQEPPLEHFSMPVQSCAVSERRASLASSIRSTPYRFSNPVVLEGPATDLDDRVQQDRMGSQSQQPHRFMTDTDSNVYRPCIPIATEIPMASESLLVRTVAGTVVTSEEESQRPEQPSSLLERVKDEPGRYERFKRSLRTFVLCGN